MYKITKQLENEGFNINTIDLFIDRNNGNNKINTLEYFVIFILFEKSEFVIETKKHEVDANNIIFIPPHTNVEFNKISSKNIIITFTASFYEKTANDSIVLNSEIFFSRTTDVFIAPMISNPNELQNLIAKRFYLSKTKNHEFLSTVAHHCVKTFILDGLMLMEEKAEDLVHLNFSYLETVNKFRLLLHKHYKEEKSVLFYSEKLFVSPQRLSVMTNSLLGKGAKKVVVDKIVNEAIKLLKNSTLTISEISIDLGFADEANFSNFIKKNLGKTPSEIRFNYIITKKGQ